LSARLSYDAFIREGDSLMFLVQFTNFTYTKAFTTMEKAVAHMIRAGFDSVLMTEKGVILGEFSAISGLKSAK
jgi:hypothetical protein